MSHPTVFDPLAGKRAGRYELVNTRGGSVLASHVESAFDSTSRRRGLLGRDSVPKDFALIIAPCSSVHTLFMRFPIDVVFVSRDGTVVKTCRDVRPWRLAAAFGAFAVIEAAPGFVERSGIVPGDRIAVRERSLAARPVL
jgi:hypothetical protein